MAISVGIVKVSSIFCSARMGIPAATRPTSGSETVPRGAVGSSDLEIETEEPSSLKSSRALIFLDEVVNLLLTLGNFASHQGILSTHVKQMFEFCLTGTTVRRK